MERNWIIGLVFTILLLWIMALMDLSKSRFKKPIMNTLCLIFVVIFPAFGPILYFIFKSKLTTKEKRKFQPSFGENRRN